MQKTGRAQAAWSATSHTAIATCFTLKISTACFPPVIPGPLAPLAKLHLSISIILSNNQARALCLSSPNVQYRAGRQFLGWASIVLNRAWFHIPPRVFAFLFTIEFRIPHPGGPCACCSCPFEGTLQPCVWAGAALFASGFILYAALLLFICIIKDRIALVGLIFLVFH